MNGLDRGKFTVKDVNVRRHGGDPHTGEPYSARGVEIEVEHCDGQFKRSHTVMYRLKGSTAVFRRNKAETEYLQERHLKTTAVADEAVQELPFVQAVESLVDAVAEVSADD